MRQATRLVSLGIAIAKGQAQNPDSASSTLPMLANAAAQLNDTWLAIDHGDAIVITVWQLHGKKNTCWLGGEWQALHGKRELEGKALQQAST